MKELPVIVRRVLLMCLALLLSACNMTGINNPFATLADGGALPPDLAIASGNPVLMWECYLQVRDNYDNGNLNAREKLEAALDMVDLLAVLSQSMKTLIPYFIEGKSPDDLSDLASFLASSSGNYLARIGGDDRIVTIVESDNASPMQLFWTVLGLYAYLLDEFGTVDGDEDITDEQYHQVLDWIDSAQQMAAEAGNDDSLAMLERLETLFLSEVADPHLIP